MARLFGPIQVYFCGRRERFDHAQNLRGTFELENIERHPNRRHLTAQFFFDYDYVDIFLPYSNSIPKTLCNAF